MPETWSEFASPLTRRAYRGRICHALGETGTVWLEDGGLLVNAEGMIEACDHWRNLESRLNGAEVIELPRGISFQAD